MSIWARWSRSAPAPFSIHSLVSFAACCRNQAENAVRDAPCAQSSESPASAATRFSAVWNCHNACMTLLDSDHSGLGSEPVHWIHSCATVGWSRQILRCSCRQCKRGTNKPTTVRQRSSQRNSPPLLPFPTFRLTELLQLYAGW